MRTLSSIYANILALYYGGYVRYHYINRHNMWEFTIRDSCDFILYRSSGIKD